MVRVSTTGLSGSRTCFGGTAGFLALAGADGTSGGGSGFRGIVGTGRSFPSGLITGSGVVDGLAVPLSPVLSEFPSRAWLSTK